MAIPVADVAFPRTGPFRMADQKPMSQDDIDALLAQMNGDTASPPPPAPQPAPRSGPTPDLVHQEEIDRVVANAPVVPATAPVAAPVPPAPVLDQSDIDSLLSSLGVEADTESGDQSNAVAAPAPAPAAVPAGPIGQDEIDALINQVTATIPGAAPAPPPAPAPPSAPAAGPIGQDEIDALVSQMEGAPAPVAEAPAAEVAPAAGPLGQDGIDALVDQLAGAPPVAVSSPPPVTARTAAAAAAAAPGGKLGQDDIDSLLAQLGAGTEVKVAGDAPPAAAVVAPTLPFPVTAAQVPGTAMPSTIGQSPSKRTLALSNEDLDALMAKHSANEPAASETMIAQADIDALVQQLATTGGEPEPAAKQAVTKALARHDQAIDRLLAANGEVAKGATDAVPVEDAARPASAPTAAAAAQVPSGAVLMAPLELRGARWMLAAAVFLLAVCAATLVAVTSAIHGLSGELKTERLAQLNPGGDFTEDLKLALVRLDERDAEQQDRGVRLLERLRLRYPGHEAEIALVLARHHRRHAVWKRAAAEYGTLLDGTAHLLDDPRVYLEYAEVLDRTGDRPAAVRQLYLLLANEAAWTGPVDLRRLPRPARESAANSQSVQEASLLLGRLLGEAVPAHAAVAAAAGHGGGH